MRIAVIGGGVSGLGAAYVLSRSGHEVHVFERDAKLGGHVNTIVHDGVALDTGFIVSNARNYPLLTALRRARRDVPALGDVVLGELRRVRARVRGPQAVRPVAECDEHGVPVAHLGGRTLAAHCAPVDRRRSVRPLLARRLPRAPALLARVSAALHRPAHVGAVAVGPRPHARDPGRVRDPLLRQPRDAGTSASSLENRHGWRTPMCRRSADTSDSSRSTLPVRGMRRDGDGVSCARTTTSCATSIARSWRPTPTRRSACSRIRATTSAASSARSGTRRTTPYCTPTPCFLPRSRTRLLELSRRRRRAPTVTYYLNRLQQLETDTDYLVTLNQPVADEHVLRRFSYTHPRFTVDAIRAQGRLGKLSERDTPSSRARTSATASTRTGSPQVPGGGAWSAP